MSGELPSRASMGNFGRPRGCPFREFADGHFKESCNGRPAFRLSANGRRGRVGAEQSRGRSGSRRYYGLDPLLPYAGRFFSGSKLLVLKIPRRLLEARTGKTRQMIARRIRPIAAESSLASSFLAMLPTHAGNLGAAAEVIVADQALDLIAVSFAKAMESGKPRISSARSLALLNLRAAVEARLADPALDTETVAAAAGVSVRYANAVLAQEGTSITRLIQTRRLARCRRALDDPLQGHRTISEIAYGWGFSDMTHFGRRFKAAFGSSPRDYRKRSCE